MAFNYVDDTVVLVRAQIAAETAAMIGVFMTMLGVPLSWHKLVVGQSVQYIGFVLNLNEWSMALSACRTLQLRSFLALFQKGNRLDKKKGLEKGVGQLQWATAVAPWLRPWLSELYRMLSLPGLRWGWLDSTGAKAVFAALSDEGVLTRDMACFSAGMSLSFVGKRVARSKQAWEALGSISKGSVAFADWSTRKVKVTPQAVLVAGLWRGFLGGGLAKMWLARRVCKPGFSAADAFASGDWASLGGWWMDHGELDRTWCWWFRLEIHRNDLARWITIQGDMQDDIAFFECLAQVSLLKLRAEWSNCGDSTVQQGCDNQTSVGALKKRLSTKEPLSLAVQAMAFWESKHDVVADVYYLPGIDNEAADQLSRWRQKGLGGFSADRELHVSVSDILGPCPLAPM